MYYSAYNIPETDDLGTENMAEYLQINCLGYYEFENLGAERYRRNGRKDYLLIYNHEGNGVARSKGKDCEIGKGTVILYHPGEEQYYKINKDCPVKSLWIHFTGYFAENVLQRLKISDKTIYPIGECDEILTLSRLIKNEIQARRIGFDVYSSSLMLQLLSAISRKYLNSGFSNKALESTNKLDLSINYLQSNYQKNITVTELSKLAGLSVSRYITVFRNLTGATPKDYLIKFRLQKAKELIRDTDLTIRQISLIVGFEDQLYFSRIFKKHEGLCPREAKFNL